MSQNDIIQKIIDGANDYADYDVTASHCIDLYCDEHKIDDNTRELAQKEYFTQSALDAGIPLSVIQGKTKLSDHFSQDYINSQIDPNDEPERDHDNFIYVDDFVFKR